MGLTFADVVDNVQQLSPDEKTKLKRFLESYIIQERRREIYENCEEGLREYAEGKRAFFSDVDELMASLND